MSSTHDSIPTTMTGMTLPGNEVVKAAIYDVPAPGYGQVLIKVKSAGLCGSDLKYIYPINGK